MMAMSDLGEALIMRGLVAKETFSKRSMCFMKSVTFSLEILLPSFHRYGRPVIFKYDLDCGSLGLGMLLLLMPSTDLK